MPTFLQLDTALKARFTGKTVVHHEQGVSVAVPVYLESSDPAALSSKRIPAITIAHVSHALDKGGVMNSNVADGSRIRESQDTSGDVPVSTLGLWPNWYRIRYHVMSLASNSAADREIAHWLETRLRMHDSIEIAERHYTLMRIDHRRIDSSNGDRVVFRQVWTIDVQMDLDVDPATQTTEAYAVKEVHMTGTLHNVRTKSEYGSLVHRPVDEDGASVDLVDATVLSTRRIAFDDETFWIPE